MKKIFIGILVLFLITACNNKKQSNQHDHNMQHDSMNHDQMQMDTLKSMKHDSMSSMNHSVDDGSMAGMGGEMMIPKTKVDDLDPSVKKFIASITNQYLSIKNGLAADNITEAKTGATHLRNTIRKFDKSFFTAKQKKEFDKYADNITEQLQGIISRNEIESQRSLFSVLSQQAYQLIKALGTTQVLYYDHCPMANNNTGADWLSETKEIKNPYFGSNMMTCGTVQEIISITSLSH